MSSTFLGIEYLLYIVLSFSTEITKRLIFFESDIIILYNNALNTDYKDIYLFYFIKVFYTNETN